MTGLLSPLLMGPAQTFQQPGNLQQLMMTQAPQPQGGGFFSQMGQNFQNNARSLLDPAIALPMAGALMSGRTFGEGMGNAMMLGGAGLSKKREKEEEKQQKTATLAFLEANYPDLAAAVEAGMPAATAWTEAMKRRNGAGDTRFSLNPIYGTDPETGETVLGTMGSDGSFKRVDTGGFQISTGVDKIDAGTHWILQDKRSGAMVGTVPKENYQEAFDKAAGGEAGRGTAEAQGAIGGARATASKIRSQVESLKNDPYLPRMLGPIDSRLPNVTADAARVQSKIDQLSGGAFLEGRQMLKGGGAITDFESTKAEQALIRMNTAQNEADFKAALDEFVAAVESGVQKLEAAARLGQMPAPAAPSGGYRILGVE